MSHAATRNQTVFGRKVALFRGVNCGYGEQYQSEAFVRYSLNVHSGTTTLATRPGHERLYRVSGILWDVSEFPSVKATARGTDVFIHSLDVLAIEGHTWRSYESGGWNPRSWETIDASWEELES